MKQSDPLELVAEGTLRKPGPIGRLTRLALGIACLYTLATLMRYAETDINEPFSSLDNLALIILFPLCVFNYVINIGYSRSWGRWPLMVSLGLLVILAGVGYLITGSLNNQVFGIPLVLWLGYFYTHLGLSFVLAAVIATPGCEMRSIPEVLGRLSGKPGEEHHCPVAFITKIDEWEAGLFNRAA
jgi:hypothetical protein